MDKHVADFYFGDSTSENKARTFILKGWRDSRALPVCWVRFPVWPQQHQDDQAAAAERLPDGAAGGAGEGGAGRGGGHGGGVPRGDGAHAARERESAAAAAGHPAAGGRDRVAE